MLTASIKEKLQYLYPLAEQEDLHRAISDRLSCFADKNGIGKEKRGLSEKDLFLITYGDSILDDSMKPLEALQLLLDKKVGNSIPHIHILPFYPYSSDDGFSVIDYFSVNPDLGEWSHIGSLAENYNLMFDGVINHISSKSDWFTRYLQGDKSYESYFIEVDPDRDLSRVTRPRALPLLTPFASADGQKHLWTTFSDDQIDLNFASDKVFIRILDLLLYYMESGASFLRLDAVGFLWKEIGTSCIHLPRTHMVIKAYREIIELVRQDFTFITETNVPHKDNISYFGNGYDEASLVYQFPLPPLVLHAVLKGNGSYLSSWASDLQTPSDETTFFNFLASHDGIGLNPVRGILPEEDILKMAEVVVKRGGHVSNKVNPDGTESPYELNISLYNALSDETEGEKRGIDKLLLVHGIQMSLAGVPAIYIHSLLGSVNYSAGVKETGRFRTINREKLNLEMLLSELDAKESRRSRIFHTLLDIINLRRELKAFHPQGSQEVLDYGSSLFTIKRKDPEGEDELLCIFNLTDKKQIAPNGQSGYIYKNLISGEQYNGKIILEPYRFGWFSRTYGQSDER